MPRHPEPSTDDIAIAIHAASIETGEDFTTLSPDVPDIRLRHFALHALLAVYPLADRSRIALCLKCAGKATYFYRSSLWYVLGHAPQAPRQPEPWWNDDALGRVVKALEDSHPEGIPKTAIMLPKPRRTQGQLYPKPARIETPPKPKPIAHSAPPKKEKVVAPARHVVVTKAPQRGARAPKTDDDVFETLTNGAPRRQAAQPGFSPYSKTQARNLLAEAVANTVRMQEDARKRGDLK